MPIRITRRRLLLVSLVFVIAAGAVAAQHFRLFERGWFTMTESGNAEAWRSRSLWLPDYRVTIEARPVEGVGQNLSALTYDPQRNTLFSVTNANPVSLVELSLEGEVLRRIELRGFQDPEAIEYVAPGRYVITDERTQTLIDVQIDDATTFVDADGRQQLAIGIDTNGNKGFEGLAYDRTNKRLLVAKERDPVRIYEVTGFPHLSENDAPVSVAVTEDADRDRGLFVRDLSSLDYDERTGHLLVLSDESRLLLELEPDGKPISSLSLLAGQHGLEKSIPQAEGVATDNNGALYLISEPNLFYRFEKKGP
ncbi:SdiA-regulated domain-containing protein [Pseudomonas sp. Marseille-QA0892]